MEGPIFFLIFFMMLIFAFPNNRLNKAGCFPGLPSSSPRQEEPSRDLQAGTLPKVLRIASTYT